MHPSIAKNSRLIVAECESQADILLLDKLVAQFDEDWTLVVLQSGVAVSASLDKYINKAMRYVGYKRLVLKKQPDMPGIKIPRHFSNRYEFWNWMALNYSSFNNAMVLRMENADLPADLLKRLVSRYESKQVDYLLFDYRQFTSCQIEIFNCQAMDRFASSSESADNNLLAEKLITGEKLREWPEKSDVEYYYSNRFEANYNKPQTISIDLSPFCNMSCDKCQYHSIRSPYRLVINQCKMMPIELAEQILKDVKQWNPQATISPTFSGEPLIYPQFEQFLGLCKSYGLNVAVTTNGLALNEEKSRLLIKNEVSAIVISIDAVDEDVYKELQPPGKLKDVRENVERLIALRGSRKKPLLGLHFVMEKRNQDQFDEYLEYWGNKVDFVSRAIHQDQFNNSKLALPTFFPLGKRQACWGPWTTMYIRWDGSVSFCGFDIESVAPELNVNKMSLAEIWNSEQYWRWRRAQINNDHSVLYCKACPDWCALRCINTNENGWKISRSPITEHYSRK